MSRMGYITHNSDCIAREAGGVYVFQGGEWCTNDPSSCVHYALQGSLVVVSAAPAHTAGTNALNCFPVERGYNGSRSTLLLEFM